MIHSVSVPSVNSVASGDVDAASLRDRIFALMSDGQWRTPFEIREVTGCSDGGITAKLRDLRKPECGGHTVDIRVRPGAGKRMPSGRMSRVYEYHLLPAAGMGGGQRDSGTRGHGDTATRSVSASPLPRVAASVTQERLFETGVQPWYR